MWPSYFIYQHKYQQTYQIMGCFFTQINCQTAKLRNACKERSVCGKRQVAVFGTRPPCAGTQCTWQPPRVVCGVLKPSASSKGSKNSARTAFSVAQDVERSLGSPRMLHGHLHQLHASSISCMLNRRVFHKMLPHSQGKFTTVQVDIQQPYVHFTEKKSARVSVSPVF